LSIFIDLDVNADRRMSLNKLFTSRSGTDIVSNCVEQFATTRFSLLRDLYLIQTTAIRLSTQVWSQTPKLFRPR